MGIYRWYSAALLVLAFATTANASTITLPVPKKSVEDLLKAASPVLNENPLGYVQAYDSPFQYQQRSYSVPVQQKVVIPDSAFKSTVKAGLKANAAAVAVDVAMAGALAAVGWVMKDGVLVKPLASDPNDKPSDGTYFIYTHSVDLNYSYAATKAASCAKFAAGNGWKTPTFQNNSCYVPGAGTYYFGAAPNKCSSGYIGDGSTCVAFSAPQTVPVTESDYPSLDQPLSALGAQQKANLLKTACAASLSPSRCYQDLQNFASFLNSGPSSIQGPTSSSTTTHKNADGTSSTTTTTSDTKFKTEYSSDGVTVKPEKTTTTKNPDGSTSETVEKDEDNSTTVQKPGETDEKENPLDKDYTFTNPDMPKVPSFYEQKYPDGLKSVWDDNKSRFDNSAFISFMKSFVPSFSGSCPTWGLPMNIMAQASYGYVTFANICYVFDFVKIVIIATAVFTARKIMFGG